MGVRGGGKIVDLETTGYEGGYSTPGEKKDHRKSDRGHNAQITEGAMGNSPLLKRAISRLGGGKKIKGQKSAELASQGEPWGD